MKASLEKIEPSFGSSFSIRKFERVGDGEHAIPHWHFHPEYEIVYISNGKGKRHIGDHLSTYEDGDLIFLGPNLPHYGFSRGLKEQHFEIVVQVKEDFLGEGFLDSPELAAIRQLFERSKGGLIFHEPSKRKIGPRLYELADRDGFGRLLGLLEVLQEMALATDYDSLHVASKRVEVSALDKQRMDAVYQYVQANFREEIKLEAVANELNMTVPAFCRYFKKLTNSTFTQFANEFRVAYARKLLREEDWPIATVCMESGFNNLSHFNKQFKEVNGLSPSEYRNEMKQVMALAKG